MGRDTIKDMSDETEPVKASGRLRIFNNLLTITAILLGLYVMLSPFLPQITWWVGSNTPIKTYADNSEKVEQAATTPIPAENRLFIPALGLDEKIYDGGLEQLKNGVLRRGHTSTPDEGSNTVLVGHRFAYGTRGVFYHLDKVKTGDMLTLHWEGKRYDYKVSEISVVAPAQVEVEDPTENEVLTVYTCTPLWTATDRLVLRADKIGESQ